MSDTPRRPSRRAFIGGAAATAAAAGVLGVLPETPAAAQTGRRRTGTLDDVEHVVILMQENRSVDHYYGTMRGVRGYGDAAALTYPDGRSVFQQPDAKRTDGGILLPFHVDTTRVDGQDMNGNDHSWGGVHQQWAGGNLDGWTADTGELTMAYFTAQDVPFNRRLAQSFTFCDQYFCSIKGPTTPNRLYHWSGMIDPHGTAGGPATSNPADYNPVFDWTTYPERLQKARVDWRVYANDEVGDGADGYLGDYGDNPLWLFQAYHDALASTDPKVHDLADRASLRTEWKPDSGKGKDVDHVLAQFLGDVAADKLPTVSWVVAPYAYSEHPAARPIDGANYVQTVLNAIWAKPDLWAKTVVLLNYDEHDGFFDHVISPTAPVGTPEEFVGGLPIGLGPRVPMTVVSPWSTGGWIDSEVFDHTSVLQFLEQWTGVREPNISAWRRTVCGNLLSAFDFRHSRTTIPLLPNTRVLRKHFDEIDPTLPPPATPAPGKQKLPVQEPGRVPARALPYQPLADIALGANGVEVRLHNHGSRAAQLSVYDRSVTPMTSQRIDVTAHGSAAASVAATGTYSVTVHGPNGFLREASGSTQRHPVEASVKLTGEGRRPRLVLTLQNTGTAAVTVRLSGAGRRSVRLGRHDSHAITLDVVAQDFGWYDITAHVEGDDSFARRFAGHVESGQPSRTG